MNKLESYIPKILESLKSLDPERVVLFGSVASGNIHEDSDIDIMVILNSKTLPKDYEERMENKIRVRDAILELSYEVAIDLVVYTTGEYRKLEKLKTPFFNTLKQTGKVIYEKAC